MFFAEARHRQSAAPAAASCCAPCHIAAFADASALASVFAVVLAILGLEGLVLALIPVWVLIFEDVPWRRRL